MHGPAVDSDKQLIIMVSSITGEEVNPELLKLYYRVRNLVSSVLFSDALKELVSPADEIDGKNAVDLLIEIGPHSAVEGPIQQITARYGIKNTGYMFMLTRGQSAVDTSLSLAARLFRHGVSLDTPKINNDSKLRDVFFLAAITLLEDIATEIILHMKPHLVAKTRSTSAAW